MMTLYSHGGGILDELVHWFVRGIAWRAGGRIVNAMPLWLIIIATIIIGIIYFVKHRH